MALRSETSPTSIWGVLDELDSTVGQGMTMQASLLTGTGALISIRVGGLGADAGPSGRAQEFYEAHLSEPPPKTWVRYSGSDPMIYPLVPRLVLANHVLKLRGVRDYDLYPAPIERKVVQWTLMADADALSTLTQALESVFSVTLLSQRHSAPS